MTSDTEGDRRLVRRAARGVAVTVTLGTALVVLAMSLLVWELSRQESAEVSNVRTPSSVASSTQPSGAMQSSGTTAGSGTTGRTEPRGGDAAQDLSAAAGIALVALLGGALAGSLGWVAAHRASRPLSEALAVQRRFVADASHELRTPLAILHTRAQLLQRRTAADDPRRATVDQLVADSRMLGEVVTDLLVVAQLDHGAPATETVRVPELLAETARSFGVLADEAGVRLEVSPTPADLLVPGSRTALRRAVSCLVDNALAHTPRGGRVVVSAGASVTPGMVALSVTDDGEGLPADRERLLERFTRGHRATPGMPRFGLGLALAREVAEAHGGSLTLADAAGGGAVATLTVRASSTPVERSVTGDGAGEPA